MLVKLASFPQIEKQIKNIFWNHHLDKMVGLSFSKKHLEKQVRAMDSISWPIMSAINQVTVEFIMVYTVNLYVILPNMENLYTFLFELMNTKRSKK